MNKPKHAGIIRQNHDTVGERTIRMQSMVKYTDRVKSPINRLNQENSRPRVEIISQSR
jgi:hypothetical protein